MCGSDAFSWMDERFNYFFVTTETIIYKELFSFVETVGVLAVAVHAT
jgi:hypothetical protein